MEEIFALIDCNNFFASCERIFNPILINKPIVILSNNDGCIIARSNEAKKIGIPMGAPYFKYKSLIEENNVEVFSSNYNLYADISYRVMETIKKFARNIEIYSIDEAFIELSHLPYGAIESYIFELRKTILKWTGITVSIGISTTKTLAKIANFIAKKHTISGIYDLRNKEIQTRVLAKISVEEIWGIGRGLAPKLNKIGINTALELREFDAKILRKKFSVMMERKILELRGISCPLEERKYRKNIISTRGFGKSISNIEDLEEAVSSYVAKACIRLRKQNIRAKAIYVFVQTNRFDIENKNYNNGISYQFISPSSDTSTIIEIAKECLNHIYTPGKQYRKAGIILMNCQPSNFEQQNFFSPTNYGKSDQLMLSLDNINKIMGPNTVFFAAEGISKAWRMKSEKRSPEYTTKWEELALVM
jgi:DNA polymerase V